MKNVQYIIIPAVAFLAACSPVTYTNIPAAPQQQPVNQNYDQSQQQYANQNDQGYNSAPQSIQVFYDELSPYGNWIDYPDYGYVWQPNVDTDFRPYVSNGTWVYSDYGWTWVSNYSWGWAPFHYGRWFYDNSYGWLWMPGQEWAPAWVTWGQSGDNYGWAPLPPRVNYNSGWRPQNSDWNFVRAANINARNVNNYVVRNTVTVINHTTIINNVTNNITVNNTTVNNTTVNNNHINNTVIYNRGPKVAEVENLGNIKIQPVKVSGSTKPGQSLNNNQLIFYRPVIKQNTAQAAIKPVPKHVIQYDQNNQQNNGQRQVGERNGQNNGSLQQPVKQAPVNNDNRNPAQINHPNTSNNNEPGEQHIPLNGSSGQNRPNNQPVNNANQQQPANRLNNPGSAQPSKQPQQPVKNQGLKPSVSQVNGKNNNQRPNQGGAVNQNNPKPNVMPPNKPDVPVQQPQNKQPGQMNIKRPNNPVPNKRQLHKDTVKLKPPVQNN